MRVFLGSPLLSPRMRARRCRPCTLCACAAVFGHASPAHARLSVCASAGASALGRRRPSRDGHRGTLRSLPPPRRAGAHAVSASAAGGAVSRAARAVPLARSVIAPGLRHPTAGGFFLAGAIPGRPPSRYWSNLYEPLRLCFLSEVQGIEHLSLEEGVPRSKVAAGFGAMLARGHQPGCRFGLVLVILAASCLCCRAALVQKGDVFVGQVARRNHPRYARAPTLRSCRARAWRSDRPSPHPPSMLHDSLRWVARPWTASSSSGFTAPSRVRPRG